jgi:hypothetical protein
MKVKVIYWLGATQHEEFVQSYMDAMNVACRNQNAFSPTFWDEQGNQLFDDGHGLAYLNEVEGRRVYAL